MHWKLFLHTVAVFALAQALALVVTRELKDMPTPFLPIAGQSASLISFFIFFFAATIFVFLLLEYRRGRFLYRSLFSIVLFVGLSKVFELVFPQELSMAIAVVFIVGLFLLPIIWVHDVVVAIAAAGIGPMFGLQFSWQAAAFILILLSVYDVIAVFVTRHMITLAQEMIRHQASFALIIPERWQEFKENLSAVQPGTGFLIVGGGDVVLPMLLTSSAYLIQPALAWWIVLGTLAGVFLNHGLLVAYRRPLPAMPFLTFGAFVGLSIGFLLL